MTIYSARKYRPSVQTAPTDSPPPSTQPSQPPAASKCCHFPFVPPAVADHNNGAQFIRHCTDCIRRHLPGETIDGPFRFMMASFHCVIFGPWWAISSWKYHDVDAAHRQFAVAYTIVAIVVVLCLKVGLMERMTSAWAAIVRYEGEAPRVNYKLRSMVVCMASMAVALQWFLLIVWAECVVPWQSNGAVLVVRLNVVEYVVIAVNLLTIYINYHGYISDAMDAGIELQMINDGGVQLMYEMYLRSDVIQSANVQPIKCTQVPDIVLNRKDARVVLQFNTNLEATPQPDGDLLFCINPLLELLNAKPSPQGLAGGDLIAAAAEMDGNYGVGANENVERLNVDVMVSELPNKRLGLYVLPYVGGKRRMVPYVVMLDKLPEVLGVLGFGSVV